MFAATQDDDGSFRLSIRRVRTIRTYTLADGVRNITFKSRARAKACADVLNQTYDYDKYFDKHTGRPFNHDEETNSVMNGIIATIDQYRE